MPDASENLAESANSQTAYSADQIAKNLGLDAAARGETEKVLAKILKKSILEDLKNTQTATAEAAGVSPKNISRPPTPPKPPKRRDQRGHQVARTKPIKTSDAEIREPFSAPVGTTPEGLPTTPRRADMPAPETPETSAETAAPESESAASPTAESEPPQKLAARLGQEKARQRQESADRPGLSGQSATDAATKQTDDAIKKLKKIRRALRAALYSEKTVGSCLHFTCVLSIFGWILRLFGFIFLGIPILIITLMIAFLEIKRIFQK